MLDVDAARERVLAAVRPTDPVDVPVVDALGLVLAEDGRASHPLPRFDNSAMDGYAVLGRDVESASPQSPVTLRVTGEIRAGAGPKASVVPGTAMRIMTGAALPPGADAVVPVEETSEDDGEVVVKAAAPSGRNVRRTGEDVDEGRVIVPAGLELGAAELAMLASAGVSPVRVHRGPRVAVLVTGDELVAPEEEPRPGQIRDSNTVALRSLVLAAGGRLIPFDVVPDDRAATLDAFKRAADDADLVVSSGGVAVGRYDYVKEVVEELGRIDLWKVAMQPGKPLVLGAIESTPFLGVPGNPVSVHICFEQFVRPAIRKMRGCKDLLRPTIEARLTERLEKRPGRLHFVRVRLAPEGREWGATPTGSQGSHIQSSLVGAHGVARFGRDESELEAGRTVTVEVWRLPE